MKDPILKILNVTTIREWRGGDHQMYMIFKELETKPNLKQFILCPETSVLAQKCKNDGSACFTYHRGRFKLISLVKKIIHVVKSEKIDVIHVHDSSALNGALVASYFLPANVKIILSRKRNNRIAKKPLNYYKYSHPKITCIVSVSNAVADIFADIIKDKERLLTIYDAIDVKSFSERPNQMLLHQEYNLQPDVKIIGNIAGLNDQKDLVTFIDTARKILEKSSRNSQIKFVLIGEGPLKLDLQEYAKSLNLENEIIFTGFRNNVADLLAEFDIFLLTSINEGLPLTIYEAFAARVSVVATDAGGIREVLVNGKTGFVTAIKDSDALSDRVLETLNNPELAASMQHNAFELVKNHHDLSNIRENYYNFYQSLR
ncbi:MAG TPA: glycosyltransferase family 4 protein [Flavobacterium sp.]|jgi:glycosyltransferase involved in cell wall biosynthesis